ncbi:ER lumen protein-retaining receptor [Tolypocladium ophioglossoides CBS 100239]|uniref:ER lumen protein-retaining receptor n=1 Tax=Tolypocladium ophioglossoides (strain CBS 100239) TaxID=1163406 RepID=A0A0L0N322_TOLOC|nr:ER lumen protein-retaining receptor [Tolypocladium ophioglossoides CBS 100239]
MPLHFPSAPNIGILRLRCCLTWTSISIFVAPLTANDYLLIKALSLGALTASAVHTAAPDQPDASSLVTAPRLVSFCPSTSQPHLQHRHHPQRARRRWRLLTTPAHLPLEHDREPPAPSATMGVWNVFRILGDLSHALSKCILILAIHRNRSAEGVSFITQALYALVFCSRYLDIFTEPSTWNLVFKISYILSSFYILIVMQWVYPRTRERELSWKMGAGVLGGSLLLSPFVMMIFEKNWSFQWWMWVFSEILESVCVLPQLLLLRQTTVPTVIDSFYLVALGSYRALYCVNWFVREFDSSGRRPDAVSVIFGIIQTALYIDFAWVYYTRQRVKLRGGGIVDADDMRRGWLLRRILGKHVEAAEADEESAPALGGEHGDNGRRRGAGRPKWGARGISVSADEGVLDTDRQNREAADELDGAVDPDAKMKDPDELAKALDDDDDDDNDAAGPSSSSQNKGGAVPNGIRGGDEWRE